MAAGPFCRGFPQALVRVMQESLMGNPQTIFVPEKGGPVPGGYRYMRARSSNADWWQDAILAKKKGGIGLDSDELRRAMQAIETCEPLNQKRREHRWLVEFIRDARRRGWCAAFDGKDSPLCVDPEPPMKRAKLGPGARRVFLALPEPDYARLLLDARALHESPNLFISGILRDRWVEADERSGMREEPAAVPGRTEDDPF